MLLCSLILLLSFNFNSYASYEISTRIHDIDYGRPEEETLVLLMSGHVARINKTEKKTALKLELAKKGKENIYFVLDEKFNIKEYRIEPEKKSPIQTIFIKENEDYEPSILENLQVAKDHFKQARYKEKESQCFNRAHIWAFEWFINNSTYSNKTWLFFTRKYIRKYKFEWWFHVSPSVSVKENDNIKEKIMDIKYTRGPIDLKRWTDIFIRNKADCPMVTTYSDYANYPETGWCFTLRSSMFYYQPYDLEMKETWGASKGNWFHEEIDQAYIEAFDEINQGEK